MPLDYTLLALPCWSCDATFAVFTDLSHHHLEVHERPWPVREADPLPPVPLSPVSLLAAFQDVCEAEGRACRDAQARHLLETLGLPPEAPAERFPHSLVEALARWRDREPTP